jgi:hypothetical protein
MAGTTWSNFEDGRQNIPHSPRRSHLCIHWDKQNELTIVAEDSFYQFYINGQLLIDYKTRPEFSLPLSSHLDCRGVTARFEFA